MAPPSSFSLDYTFINRCNYLTGLSCLEIICIDGAVRVEFAELIIGAHRSDGLSDGFIDGFLQTQRDVG